MDLKILRGYVYLSSRFYGLSRSTPSKQLTFACDAIIRSFRCRLNPIHRKDRSVYATFYVA